LVEKRPLRQWKKGKRAGAQNHNALQLPQKQQRSEGPEKVEHKDYREQCAELTPDVREIEAQRGGFIEVNGQQVPLLFPAEFLQTR
jgi:hypothetical protein